MEKDLDQSKEEKSYKRGALKKLSESENRIINIQKSKILENKFGQEKIKQFSMVNLTHLFYYFYTCESVNDMGWGCVCRSMQSLLKYQLSLTNQNKDNAISFYNLFIKYGNKDTLIEIYKKMNKNKDISKTLDILKNTSFSPYENEDGWAEPFISQLVLYDFGFEGELILIDHYCERNCAPKEVFERIIDFEQFKEKLKNHFSQNNPAPVIMDDASISICIIGFKFNEENKNIELFIMDPHSSFKPEIGLYIIVLNDKGKIIEIMPNEMVLASPRIYFDNNNAWMAYFPKSY